MHDLVHVQLGHVEPIGTRNKLDGPRLHLNAAAAQAIGLALHELATNAGKYGAPPTDAGCFDVSWLDERNRPPERPPQRKGFGSTVTASMLN